MPPPDLQSDLLLKNRALEATAEGIVITNALRPDNPIIYANAGFERLTGYAAAEVLGSNCRLLQGPDTQLATREELSRAIRERRPCTLEILNYRKDGSRFWNRLSVTPIRDGRGEVTHFIGVQSDVTERREAEDALRSAKAELEAINETIRHDLDTAARIQRALLPVSLPQPRGYRFAWHFLPSAELAGDTLNVLWLGPDQVARLHRRRQRPRRIRRPAVGHAEPVVVHDSGTAESPDRRLRQSHRLPRQRARRSGREIEPAIPFRPKHRPVLHPGLRRPDPVAA